MSQPTHYAVFLHPQAIESLGAPIRPYLRDAGGGPHIVCSRVDASGPLFTMRLLGRGDQGEKLELEIMLPVSAVKLVMSMRGEHDIGYL